MNKIISDRKLLNGLIYVSIFFIFFYILKPVKLTYGDDLVYMNILSAKSYFNWIKELYYVWSGRVVLTSLLVLFLNLPLILWRVVNAYFFTLLVISLIKLSKLRISYIFLVLFFTLFLPINVLNSSSFWITGSIVYLWPISCTIYLLFILKEFYENRDISNQKLLFCIFLSILASNNEQTGLVLIAFYTLIFILLYIENKRINKKFLLINITLVFGFLVLMLAPGNLNRLNIEVAGIMPTFPMLTVYDRIMYGLNFTFQILFYDFKYNLLIITLLLTFISLKFSKKAFVISLIPLSIISIKIIFDYYIRINPYCTFCNDLHYILFNYKYFSVINFYEFIHLIPIFIMILFLFSVLISSILVISNTKDAIYFVLIFFAGILSSIILGFSPTIEASGNRIYLLMLVMLLSFKLHLLSLKDIVNNKYLKIIINMFIALLIFKAIREFANVTDFIVLY